MPATSQAAIIMATLSAFIIPIGALVAGEGLAALALERRSGSRFREERWQEVAFTVIYWAVFVHYLQQGLPERDARCRASTEVKGYLGRSNSSAVRLLSAPNGQSEQAGKVKASVWEHLDANPDLYMLSINQVLTALKKAGVQVGRTTVAEVLQERKQGE